MNNPKHRSTRQAPGLAILASFLGIAGILFAVYGIWLLVRGSGSTGALSAAAGAGLVASAAGIYQLKRWGIALFGLLGLLGSINHLAATLNRYANLPGTGLGMAALALVNILMAILIPIGVLFVAIIMWKQARW